MQTSRTRRRTRRPSPLVLAKTRGRDAPRATVLNRPMTDLEAAAVAALRPGPGLRQRPVRDRLGQRERAALHRGARPTRLRRRGRRRRAPSPRRSCSDPTACRPSTASGRFVTSSGQAPTPFALDPSDMQSRDPFGRALNAAGQPIYDYVDTSQSYLSALLGHLQGAVSGTSLLDSKPADDHESLMGSLAGAYVLFGPRSNATRSYADGSKVAYQRLHASRLASRRPDLRASASCSPTPRSTRRSR